ncbi:LOW QUALITY PROTEIN: putative protein phosphatase 2C 24 [Phragmites australis]|uniref:LOW QUALITY PROTEIN: putative protein phosphatase 2C 24 n=1 Tax=Phragmites australis TaxID=29695 RepID=UPI002D770B0D|nr:LOW QUALITY PROTEIN: putative protein phosphatase 2C 24 [Phragmites australis]
MECDKEEPPRDLRMEFESCYVPDHNEDAHFGHARTGVIGVADGLMALAGIAARGWRRRPPRRPGTRVCPLVLLDLAHHRTVLSRTPAASTAVILSLAGRALKWAYVGDSGFAVLRDGRILYRSKPQQQFFHCPLQLNATGGTTVADAAGGKVPAKEGRDVVVVGTDGLFDNVWDDELERIVRMGTAMGFSPMAEAIAASVHETATCRYKDMPYSVEKLKHQGTATTGGKPDDITVVVAFIVSYD